MVVKTPLILGTLVPPLWKYLLFSEVVLNDRIIRWKLLIKKEI
jgi:hypothetical protein